MDGHDVNVELEEGVLAKGTSSILPETRPVAECLLIANQMEKVVQDDQMKKGSKTKRLLITHQMEKAVMQDQGTASNYYSSGKDYQIKKGSETKIEVFNGNDSYLASKNGDLNDFSSIVDLNEHMSKDDREERVVQLDEGVLQQGEFWSNATNRICLDAEKLIWTASNYSSENDDESITESTWSDNQIKKDNDLYSAIMKKESETTNIFKDYDLYLASKNGDLNNFISIFETEHLSSGEILKRVSPIGNTFLHVAAVHGNISTVNYIAAKDPSVLLRQNLNGDTALHLVAKAGDESMVKALVLIQPRTWTEGENNLLRTKNESGNTALHEALINGRELIAQYLINEDPELIYCCNKQGKDGMYLAAEAGFAKCVSTILEYSTDHERIYELFKKRSPIKAAILNKQRDVLKLILDSSPLLIKLEDRKGRIPLHYAASSGDVKVVRDLLERHASGVTQRDKSGASPIHLAAIKGHVDTTSLLLEFCPDPVELLDNNFRNILHLVAMSGKLNIVKYILHNPKLEKLINMSDKLEKTPLHLATDHWHPEIVSALTWDKRVDINLTNGEGRTALDVAENLMSNNPPFSQLLTWVALKAAGTPRRKVTIRHGSLYSSENYKERVNTLLLVSALVATMTFAAGFTLPGGYSSSDADQGMAIMLRKKAFHLFIFCDTIAMYSSIIAAVSLIWAQLGDLRLELNCMTFAQPLLVTALTMMSMAFTAGIFLVVRNLQWLSIVILVLGLTFLAVMLVILVPLCMPLASSNRIVRYISYYPFWLLILVSRTKSPDKKDG